MLTVWYLVIFGIGFDTSQTVPQASRAQCVANAAWYENQIDRKMVGLHAYCFEGVQR